jgi:cytochrome P450
MTLTYVSYELAKHPEYFPKLAAELTEYSTIDSLQSSELEKLPLLNAVIKETLRLYPPAASPIFSRVVPEGGAKFEGYEIPAGVLSRIAL